MHEKRHNHSAVRERLLLDLLFTNAAAAESLLLGNKADADSAVLFLSALVPFRMDSTLATRASWIFLLLAHCSAPVRMRTVARTMSATALSVGRFFSWVAVGLAGS